MYACWNQVRSRSTRIENKIVKILGYDKRITAVLYAVAKKHVYFQDLDYWLI